MAHVEKAEEDTVRKSDIEYLSKRLDIFQKD